MYQALYRKYRPVTFGDVYGQAHITTTLKNSLAAGKISHAYLFTGTRGTGKTSCAKILAKAVCCLNPVDGEPCGECAACKAVAENKTTDVLEIDAASNNGVNDIRELRDQVNYLPAALKYRVYIIDEVHMLSGSAFNALLKTLEEPPAHIIFILATTEVHKLPATILSRCQRFDFKRLEPEVLCQRMQYIAEKEGFTLDAEAAELIAGLADGGMRDALSILDQCSSCFDHITAEVVASVCGIAGTETTHKLVSFIYEKNTAGAVELLDELYKNSVDMKKLLFELTDYYRNLMVIKTVQQSRRLIVCADKEYADMQALSEQMTLADILSGLSYLQSAGDELHNSGSRTDIELIIVRLCNGEFSAADALERRIARLEAALNGGTAIKSVAPPAPVTPAEKAIPTKPAKPAEKSPAKKAENPKTSNAPEVAETPAETFEAPEPPEAELGSSPVLVNRWPDVLAELRKTCPLLAGVLEGSRAYTFGPRLLVDCKLAQFRDLINSDQKYRDYLKKAAAKVLGVGYKLGPYNPEKYNTATESDPLAAFANSLKDET